MAVDKIMIVDDDQNIRSVLRYRLEKEGYDVLLAGDGVDALEKVRAENPDLIILDLTMPKMDGFGLLEKIKGNGSTSGVPVIVLTAYGYESNRARSLELGVVEFVTKPFSPRQLVSEVWKVLDARKKRVLVVDDEAPVRDLLAGLLEAEGCVVDTAEDGPGGVEKALAGDSAVHEDQVIAVLTGLLDGLLTVGSQVYRASLAPEDPRYRITGRWVVVGNEDAGALPAVGWSSSRVHQSLLPSFGPGVWFPGCLAGSDRHRRQ